MTFLRTALYRLNQVKQQLGFVAPLTSDERLEVARWLPSSALTLFYTMSLADQQHSLRVCRGLQVRGCVEADMLAAALLHDVGKAQGRVPFWTRPIIVIGKSFAPRLLKRLVLPFAMLMDVAHLAEHDKSISTTEMIHRRGVMNHALVGGLVGEQGVMNHAPTMAHWQLSLSYAWWHAEAGAMLADEAGLAERAVLYIRTHHQPHGPAAELHLVDEQS